MQISSYLPAVPPTLTNLARSKARVFVFLAVAALAGVLVYRIVNFAVNYFSSDGKGVSRNKGSGGSMSSRGSSSNRNGNSASTTTTATTTATTTDTSTVAIVTNDEAEVGVVKEYKGLDDSKGFFKNLETEAEKFNIDYCLKTAFHHNFIDISCPRDTVVSTPAGSHLHANYVDLGSSKVICAQYPCQAVHQTFWTVVLEESKLVVDLTKPASNAGYIDGKTDLGKVGYYPTDPNDSQTYGDVKVTCLERTNPEEFFVLYKLKIEKGTNQKEVYRLHYQNWENQDGTFPHDLLKIAMYIIKYAGETRPIVHCASGTGRSGTLVTALEIFRRFMKRRLNEGNALGQVEEIILKGRKERSPYFVQDEEQLKSLFEMIEILFREDGKRRPWSHKEEWRPWIHHKCDPSYRLGMRTLVVLAKAHW